MAEDYVIRVLSTPAQLDARAWDALLASQSDPSPFMRHAYLAALTESGSATPVTGWTPHFITVISQSGELLAACAVYEKTHSYGEYIFDWAWAKAYAQHQIPYYPKATVAVPFTPVPGARLLAKTKEARAALLQALLRWCEGSGMSSLHLLFVQQEEADACTKAGLMLRHGVQFHWKNTLPDVETLAPTLVAARTALDMPQPQATALRPVPPCAGRLGAAGLSPEGERFDLGRPGVETVPFRDFEHFLASLSQEKRKKIRQERRKVAQAGVSFRWARGTDISTKDWDFFYRCYERTYLEHGNAPYLSRDFFARMANTMAENWLLFTAQRGGQPIATSLIAVHVHSAGATDPIDLKREVKTAYGRYWGALERVDCLHFEACYYQPLEWCIAHGYQRFEGGAQGEHKMARALLPVRTTSAHWLAHPDFADAVARFLEREGEGVNAYVNELEQRSPFRQTG